MKSFFKMFFVIGVLSFLAYLNSSKTDYQLSVLALQNVEALALGEGGMNSYCVGSGSLDCPSTLTKVQYVSKVYSMDN